MHTGLTGSGQVNNRGSLGAFVSNENAEGTAEPLIGRKVWTRWPEDNSFYEAVITDYNHAEVCFSSNFILLHMWTWVILDRVVPYFGQGRHALVYDINTAHETWEWVNLKEVLPSPLK